MSQVSEVFVRKASGLVRVMSPYSAFAYNVLAIGILFPWLYVWATAVFPQANVPLGIILTCILLIPMWFTYSWLAASMPRTGGDYVFQTRIISGPVGFFISLFAASFATIYTPFAGWMLNTTGLAPLVGILEYSSGTASLSNTVTFLNSPWGTIIVTLVILVPTAILLIRGFRHYVNAQRFLWYGLLLSIIAILYVTSTTSHEQFIANFNAFYAWAAPEVVAPGGYFQYIIDAALADGVNLNPGISWIQTLGVCAIAANSLVWAMLAVNQLGEIKGANQVKNTTFMIVGSGIFSTVIMALIAYFLIKVAGNDFIHAIAYSYWTGNIAFPVPPWLATLASIATITSPILVIIICLGIVLNAIQVFCNIYISCGRIAFAAALDGMFPNWLSEVHPKYRAPVNLYIAFIVLITIETFLYNLWEPLSTSYLSVAAGSTLFFAVTCIAGALFPHLKKVKAIYEASPINHLKIGKIPWITITGVLGAVVNIIILVLYIGYPDLGVYNPLSVTVIICVYIFWLIYYYVRKAFLKRKGVDVELAFRQIPPD